MVLQYISIILALIRLNQYYNNNNKKKDLVLGGVHSPEFKFEKNQANVKKAVQTGITHPAIEAGMVENHTITTIKLNATKFQQLDKSQFMKAPEFAQISGYINTE